MRYFFWRVYIVMGTRMFVHGYVTKPSIMYILHVHSKLCTYITNDMAE